MATRAGPFPKGRPLQVLVYEPNHTGHHFAYLGRIMPSLVELPVSITLATTPEAVHSDEYARCLAPFDSRMHRAAICTRPPPGTWPNARHRLRELRRALAATSPDHLMVMYGEGIWQLIAQRLLLGLQPWPRELAVEMWLYRGGFTYPGARGIADRLKRGLFKRLLRSGVLTRIHLDDEYLYDFAKSHQARAGGTTLELTPNPVAVQPQLDPLPARQRSGLPAQGRIVSLLGMIDRRKGADLLLAAFGELCRAGSGDDTLVLAGPHDQAIREMLARAPYRGLVQAGRIVSIDRFINEVELFAVASASNLLVAPYPAHSGRSSVILWAAAAGRPSLGSTSPCIELVIRSQRLGWTVDVRDQAAFTAALERGLANPWTKADVERVRTYAKFHSIENYRSIATALVRKRCQSEIAR